LTVDWDFQCGKKYKSEIAFIEYGLKNLKTGGILGMVVPDSILANSKEKDFRKHIMDHNTLLAVISFPTEAFYFTGTSVKTSLLMIQKGREIADEDYKLFMAIAEKIGHDKRGNSCDR
jgi:type I restriction enzyme M protein